MYDRLIHIDTVFSGTIASKAFCTNLMHLYSAPAAESAVSCLPLRGRAAPDCYSLRGTPVAIYVVFRRFPLRNLMHP